MLVSCIDGTTEPDLPQPAAITIVSGDDQIQGRGRDLHEPVVVRAEDSNAAPMAGVVLTFTPGPDNGSVSVSSAETDATGTATADWQLGQVAGPHTLTVAAAGGAVSVKVTATARPGDFDIQVVADTSLTTGQRDAVRAGVERWAQVIVNDLPDLRFEQGHMPTNHCRFIEGLEIAPGETVDDVLLSFMVLDVSRVLLTSILCNWRDITNEPFLVNITMSSGLLATLDDPALSSLIAHHTGHLLGFGWRWGALLRNPSRHHGDGADTHFPDRSSVAAFDAAGGGAWAEGSKVPVENFDYPRLGDHHWRGDVLQDEIMSGWNHGASLSSNSPPLSAITVLSMVALGYDVDVSKADPYTVPAAGTAPVIAGRHVRGEPGSVGLMVDAIEIFDENGRLIGITYR